jgi:DNA-binding response OmpR family regulator
VLLVEDTEDDAFFFQWSAKKSGVPCDIVRVADGAAAIAHLEKVTTGSVARPDFVFLDLKIPTYSGFEVLSWIRDQTFAPPLDVAVLSGSENAGDIERAMGLGASAYFVKPISIEVLRGRLTGGGTPRSVPLAPVVGAATGR